MGRYVQPGTEPWTADGYDDDIVPPERPKFNLITTEELASTDYTVEELIKGVIVKGQPGVILGAHKTLKTSIGMALAYALATGRPFLDKFETLGQHRVVFFSGESGLGTLKETLGRICEAGMVEMYEVQNLIVSDTIPQIANIAHIDELRRIFTEKQTQVVIVDPLYLALDSDGREGSIFAMGKMLLLLSKLCQELGITLLLCHHLKRGNGETKGHADLADASWAGCAEFARQWIVLNRRTKYEPGSGTHELWMNVGGSAGMNGLYAVTVDEGVGIGKRHWSVAVEYASEIREREEQEQESRDAERRQRVVDGHVVKLKAALNDFPEGETASALATAAGLNAADFREAFGVLKARGEVEACQVKKSRGTYDGIRKRNPWAHTQTVKQGPTNEGSCPTVGASVERSDTQTHSL